MYIGIDIGGTSIKGGIVDIRGNIVKKITTETRVEEGYDVVRDDIYILVDDLMKESKKMGYDILSIGIGVPGIVDVNNDYIINCTNLKWSCVPLGIDMKHKYNIPIYIDNDATVAGIAENVQGITKGFDNSIFVTLGTGVGGGIIINGKVYSGSHNKGSEIGHMVIGDNFYNCNCGNNGCLETFASATAIVKYTKKLIEEGDSNEEFNDAINGNLHNIDTKLVFDMAKKGNVIAIKSVNRMLKYLSIGLGNLINLLDPDIIAIGGGVSKAGEYLIENLNDRIKKYLIFDQGETTKIVLSKLGNDAGIIGAGLLSKYK